MAKRKEQWSDHLIRLSKWKNKPGATGEYDITFKPGNAVDYGMPQKRMHVLVISFRADQKTL